MRPLPLPRPDRVPIQLGPGQAPSQPIRVSRAQVQNTASPEPLPVALNEALRIEILFLRKAGPCCAASVALAFNPSTLSTERWVFRS